MFLFVAAKQCSPCPSKSSAVPAVPSGLGAGSLIQGPGFKTIAPRLAKLFILQRLIK